MCSRSEDFDRGDRDCSLQIGPASECGTDARTEGEREAKNAVGSKLINVEFRRKGKEEKNRKEGERRKDRKGEKRKEK